MSQPTDQQLDESIAGMLRFGVALAAFIVLAGAGALLLHQGSAAAPDFARFHAGGPELRTLRGIAGGVKQLRARSIIQLGLVVLIATPVARVVYCVVGFARQRNLLYVAVSSLVLAILLYSLTKGGY
jgi:uncharacterized membrane protein